MKKGFLILILAFFILLPSVGATNYYVRTDGNDANAGTTNSSGGAWGSIGKCGSTIVAGDVCRIQSGTYTHNHTTFSNSGTAGNWIKYQGDGVVVMDGVDYTGTGFTFPGTTNYTNISGITIKRYQFGINGENYETNFFELYNVTIRDTSGSSIDFGGMDVKDLTIRNYTQINTSELTLEFGSGRVSRNFLLENFNFTDTQGMRIEYTDGVTIRNGTITNTPSDGLKIREGSSNILIENIILNGTGWHGFGIWDATADNAECCSNIYNVTVRHNALYNFAHNGIDVVAFNVHVYNNTFSSDIGVSGSNGIYFQDRGNNITIENNTIVSPDNSSELQNGIKFIADCALCDDIRNVTIRNNLITNVSSSGVALIVTSNATVENNTILNAGTEKIYISQSEVNGFMYIINNTFDGYSKIRLFKKGSFTVRNQMKDTYLVMSSQGAVVATEYTDGTIFTKSKDNSGCTGWTLNQSFWTPTRSYFMMSSNSSAYSCYISASITKYNSTIIPSNLNLTVTSFSGSAIALDLNNNDITRINVTFASGDGAVSRSFTFGNVSGSPTFKIYNQSTDALIETDSSSPYTFSALPVGSYYILNGTSAADTTPPGVTIVLPVNGTSDAFNFTFSETPNWAAYSIDGDANITNSSPSTMWTGIITGYPTGDHTITVCANDTANNMNCTSKLYNRASGSGGSDSVNANWINPTNSAWGNGTLNGVIEWSNGSLRLAPQPNNFLSMYPFDGNVLTDLNTTTAIDLTAVNSPVFNLTGKFGGDRKSVV